jgi:hypothetical protein
MLEDEKYIKSGPPKYYINMAPTKGDHIVQDITRDGHTFLDKIRDNKAWSIAKGLMKNAAPITFAAILDFLGQAATKMF